MITVYLCALDGCVFGNKRNAIRHAEYLLNEMRQSGMMGPDYYVRAIYKEDSKDEKLRKMREKLRDLQKDFEWLKQNIKIRRNNE